jgi:hypothetical protein
MVFQYEWYFNMNGILAYVELGFCIHLLLFFHIYHTFFFVSAAIQLGNKEDRLPSKGDTIKYIYTDSQHKNPLFRVASIDPTNGINGKLDYDKEKYKEMILDAAETVLGYFGFDRSIYGNKKNIGPRKWRWLQEQRQDIRTEVI